jgi:hypothetical protein
LKQTTGKQKNYVKRPPLEKKSLPLTIRTKDNGERINENATRKESG